MELITDGDQRLRFHAKVLERQPLKMRFTMEAIMVFLKTVIT